MTLLKYCNDHSGNFSSPLAAYTLALMMLSVSIMTESMNLYLLCSMNEIVQCIIKTLAFRIIAWSSETYTMSQFVLEDVVKEPPKVYNRSKDISFTDRNALDKVARILYKAGKVLYKSIYFNFMPYLVILFTYVMGKMYFENL